MLLAASYFFYYSWEPRWTAVLAACTVVAYSGGLTMAATSGKGRRVAVLATTLTANAGVLLVLKYFNFFSRSARDVAGALGVALHVPAMNLLLPVGISFYTFKLLGYLVDTYRGSAPERHLGHFAVYVAFFPQILAGPIERASNFLPQLREKVRFDYGRTVGGMRLMLWGLVKKVVIADRLAWLVDHVYAAPVEHEGLPLVVATYLFAFQIYCDFSGYSDLAIGAGKILGFDTMLNFNRPYFAKSTTEFWRRWHISLSSWFRDYLYIPLGGSRVKVMRWAINVLIVFLISGLWHGAGWTFVLWGAIHGAYLVAGRLLKPVRERVVGAIRMDRAPALHEIVRMAVTFHVVTFAWIFFRADSLADAWYVVSHLTAGWDRSVAAALAGYPVGELVFAAGLLALLIAAELWQEYGNAGRWFAAMPRGVRWAVYAAGTLAVVNLRPVYEAPFLYMQF